MLQFGRLLRCCSWSRLSAYRTKHMLSVNSKQWNVGNAARNNILPLSIPDPTRAFVTTSSRHYSVNDKEDGRLLREFDDAVSETLISLSDMFDDIAETLDVDADYDVSFENDVLTVVISKSWGTYVINKQTPNRQIWLSSPLSGPKRYDLVNGRWVYSHDGNTLHELLSQEISEALKHELNFTECAYGG